MEKAKSKKIIYIESDDEISGIISKLSRVDEKTIILVIPKGAVVLQSAVNLKLLQRHAKDINVDLSVVTTDEIGKNLALQVGLQVLDRVDSESPLLSHGEIEPNQSETIQVELDETAKKAPVPIHHFQDNNATSQNEENSDIPAQKFEDTEVENFHIKNFKTDDSQPRVKKKFNIKKTFINILILMALGGGLLFFHSASIIITVIGEPFEQSQKVTVVDETKKDAPVEGPQLAGKLIELEKKETDNFDATGKKNIGQKTRATIDFYNNWSTESQNISKNTIITKDSKNFVLLSDVVIPGATLSLQEGKITTNPGKTSGSIEAENPGEDYNVKAGNFTILSLTSDKQAKIYGTGAKDLTGGSSQEVKIISQDDFDNAVSALKKKADESIKQEITAQTKDRILLDNALEIIISEKKSDKNVGSQVDKFAVTIKATAKALTFIQSDFESAFIESVSKQIPEGKSLIINNEKDQIITTVKIKDYEKGIMEINATIKTQLAPKIDLENIKNNIKFKNSAQINEYISSNNKVESVNVGISPNWMPIKRTPLIKKRIEVKLEYK
ncbi:MAG: hypothetical protein CEN91_257 [Candidatus Berkelbacteria bacterium Licking1014_85]|uniref:Baseplate protein J-like domain-containing protein n=1 Tax=Candidatus Berkelbacteria bacterium Licking1014_85 TaxID=2017148 RepID=A0A554LKB1_9BACT|nr:MAG: hypothetical protein CEN91_257 [Candidatus Berkelbacteria bacterium Licking1014_85]